MIRKHNNIRSGKKFCDFRIGYIAVYKCDPLTITASINELVRQSPSLPGLTNDSEPVPGDFVLWQTVKGHNKIIKPLIRSNQAKKQEIAAGCWRNSMFLLSFTRLIMIIRAMWNHCNRALFQVIMTLQQFLITIGVNDKTMGQAHQKRCYESYIDLCQRQFRLSWVLYLVKLNCNSHSQ